jgi:hypothetical protein
MLLLVSVVSSEGFDFFYSRHVHLFEYYWHESLIKQVIGRGVRLGGHLALPENERNIQPYVYLSGLPIGYKPDPTFKDDLTTDFHIYKLAIIRQIPIDEGLEVMKRASIDCQFHYQKNCKICSPTNKKLYFEDIDIDMNSKDPCVPPKEEKMEVTEIIVDGKKYYYDKKFNIIVYDENLNGYVPMNIHDPLYKTIYDEITRV